MVVEPHGQDPASRPDRETRSEHGREPIEAVFARLETPLLGYALRWGGDRARAEDLVQEAFMRLHTQYEAVREPGRWLYRTIHNLALNQIRDSAKIVPFEPSSQEDGTMESSRHEDPGLLPDEALGQWERIEMVRSGVETLDPRSREIVRLKFEEDLSYQEISQRTGLTPGHVGYLLHHALKALGDVLEKNGMIP